MKNKKLLLLFPFIGTLVTSLSGCSSIVYEYGTMNNLLYNHWNCGWFENITFPTKSKFNHVHDKKEIVLKNLKKMKVKATDSLNVSGGLLFQYGNSILNKEKNCHYDSNLFMWVDGSIKILATSPNTYNLSIVHFYKISPEDAQKINNEVNKWFEEVQEMEKEFLEFTAINTLLTTASKENHNYFTIYYGPEAERKTKKVNKEFVNLLKETTYTDLGYEGHDSEFAYKHLYNDYYDGESIYFTYSRSKTEEKFGGYRISYIDFQIFDDGIAYFNLFGDDKADRYYSLKTFYSLDEAKAKEIINAAKAQEDSK